MGGRQLVIWRGTPDASDCADCGADNQTLDRLCLSQGWCGYPNVEAALRDAQIGDDEAVQTELRRQLLVQQIRIGRISGLFEQQARNSP